VSEFRALAGLKGGEAMMVRRYFEKCPPRRPSFLFFKDFIYFFEREGAHGMHKQGKGQIQSYPT